MSNAEPMGWGSRMANYAARNGGAEVRLTPRQSRRWRKKHNAEMRRWRDSRKVRTDG